MKFFWKKDTKTHNEAVSKRSIKKMDAIVTGAILGGVVASLYGVKKMTAKKNPKAAKNHTQTKEITQNIHEKIHEIIKTLPIQKKSEKKWFFQKIFSRFFS